MVVAVDLNDRNLEIARQLGADHLINAKTQNVADTLKTVTPDGADVVFECTGIPACIDLAIPLCRVLGSFVWQGNYGEKPISMHFTRAWRGGCGCSSRVMMVGNPSVARGCQKHGHGGAALG